MNLRFYRVVVFIVVSFCCSSVGFAQKDLEKEISQAKKYISLEEYNKAKVLLEGLFSSNKSNAKVQYYYGIAQLNLQENKAGKTSIKKALDMDPNVDPEFGHYWQGVAHYHNYETKEAKENFEKYKATLSEKSDMRPKVNALIASLEAIEGQKGAKPDFYVESIEGEINTSYQDHSPLLTADGNSLIYTSKNQESTDRKEKKRGEFFENIYVVDLDGFKPIGTPESLSEALNTDRHDASVQLFDNGSKMLLYKIDRGGDIYQSNKDNGSWSQPKPLGKNINSNDFESSAYVLADGKTMYFSSSRKSKSGSLNIYKTTIGKDGNWQEPELLGPEINTEDTDEDCPFVTNDGKTIYFSSKGHNSIGGYDIFVSHWNESENKWSEAQNLGIPVNSTGDDMYFMLDNTNIHGYFASFREGGKGGMDIYHVGKILTAVLVADIQVEGKPKAQVGEIKAKLKNKEYGNTYESISDDGGVFRSSLDANSTYEVSLYSENYKDGKEPFSVQTVSVPRTLKANEQVEKSIEIPLSDYQKLERNYQLMGSVSTTSGRAVDGSLEIRNSATQKTIASTQTKDGKFTIDFKSVFGESYSIKLISSAETFENAASFTTEDNTEIEKDVVIEFSEENEILASTAASKTTKKAGYTSSHAILFSNNSTDVSGTHQKELARIVSSIKSNAEVHILIEGYADNVGRASYNKRLSKKRAKQVERYLVGKGLNKKQIEVEFYGEKNPVADNSTEEGRKLNRRVEIHIK